MADFTQFQQILPDPYNYISYSGSSNGSDTGAAYGPGFASVKLTSKQPTVVSRTNSGRVITRALVGHTWSAEISYNKLTESEFNPVYSFLISRMGRVEPFFIVLPQYTASNDTTFAAAMSGGTTITAAETAPAGRKYLLCTYSGGGSPRPGDIFTISDSANSNHKKLYMVTRTETNDDYNSNLSTRPTTGQRRIHFTPSLNYSTASGSTLDFTSPLMRVISTTDVTQYDLETDGLYSFNLKVEEALP